MDLQRHWREDVSAGQPTAVSLAPAPFTSDRPPLAPLPQWQGGSVSRTATKETQGVGGHHGGLASGRERRCMSTEPGAHGASLSFWGRGT